MVRGVRFALLLLAACVALSAIPAAASAAATWQSGPLVESQDVNCITSQTEQEAGAFLSYYADPANPPQVGQVYYVAIDIAGIGDPCSGGAYADVQLSLPSGTQPAISAADPVRCYFKFPNQSSYVSASSVCPSALGTGPYGYYLDPINMNPPFWQIVQGDAVEVQVPVVSSQPLNGVSKLQAVVQLADGQSDPVLQPSLVVIVNPSGAQNVGGHNEQIGVLYPANSITSQAIQANTSVTAGIKGYVENNSNPGSVVAQISYADTSGDCNSPPAPFYTTPATTLQSPQTEITGSFTGLYQDVAFCWRLVATVTSGAQAGIYYGNWQYFVTVGSYQHFSNEPVAANPPAAGSGCTSNGNGCSTSNCTSASCSTTGSPTAVGHTVAVTLAGSGSGGVSDGKSLNCPSACSATYLSGTSKVTLTATPSGGSTFTGWSGGGCSGTGTCTVTLSANESVTATFTAPPAPPPAPAGSVQGVSTSSLVFKITAPGHARGSKLSGSVVVPLAGSTATEELLVSSTATKHVCSHGHCHTTHTTKWTVVGRALQSGVAAGTDSFTVALTSAETKVLKRKHHLTLRLTVIVTHAGTAASTVSQTVTLST